MKVGVFLALHHHMVCNFKFRNSQNKGDLKIQAYLIKKSVFICIFRCVFYHEQVSQPLIKAHIKTCMICYKNCYTVIIAHGV